MPLLDGLFTKVKHKFFQEWFFNWSPDVAQRYIPIANDIRKAHNINTILDVGSGSLGITPYLKRKVTGLDITFKEPSSVFLKRTIGSADNLPFKKKSFDASVCADVLEHIPRSLRKKVISELIRVTRKKIYIVGPTGDISEKEDKLMFNYIKTTNQWIDPYLTEHLKYGLPAINELISYIPSRYVLKIRGLTNIYLHRLILKAQFSQKRAIKFFSSVILVLLTPALLLINLKPTYRTFIEITLDN